jgi:hypothetical protein
MIQYTLTLLILYSLLFIVIGIPIWIIMKIWSIIENIIKNKQIIIQEEKRLDAIILWETKGKADYEQFCREFNRDYYPFVKDINIQEIAPPRIPIKIEEDINAT